VKKQLELRAEEMETAAAAAKMKADQMAEGRRLFCLSSMKLKKFLSVFSSS
jgi:hypothetical protein